METTGMNRGDLRICMVAYACNPCGDGEHWLGWGWAVVAERLGRVWLVTPPKHEMEIRAAVGHLDIVPVFVALPGWLVTISEQMGLVGAWLRKLVWNEKARRVIRRLNSEVRFGIIHQTTFHSFRVPFSGRGLGVPSVWGPIAGGESVPPGFGHYLGKAAKGEACRRWLNRITLMLPWIRQSFNECSVILVSNRTTRDFFPSRYRSKCQVLLPNSVRDEDLLPLSEEPRSTNPAVILYVGSCVERRGLRLLFEAMTKLDSSRVRLVVVGAGPALAGWKGRAEELELGERVSFLGMIPPSEVRLWYDRATVFVFPSLRDGGGSGLMEAMTRGVPLVCLDWGGPAEMVDESCGIRVQVGSPEATVAGLRQAILDLTTDSDHARKLGLAARSRAASQFTWAGKEKHLAEIYLQITPPGSVWKTLMPAGSRVPAGG
ncbi:MAG: glycosyltransferase family 4 protein, partial [Verrucomicrobiota bacterium]